MEMSWSTFILEIFNFLILVWILKHFLYKPVLGVIERRQSGIRQTLADAEAMRAEAQELQERNEGRLAEWDLERQQAREALASELEDERARKMAKLEADIEQERLKARVTGERQQADTIRRIEEAALGQGARFAARLLEQAAGPELQARLVEDAGQGPRGPHADGKEDQARRGGDPEGRCRNDPEILGPVTLLGLGIPRSVFGAPGSVFACGEFVV